jgi:phthalate 4,5-dioxygenase
VEVRTVLSAEDNEILTRVGPGTPMGELLRRYWIPACLSTVQEALGR